MILNKIVDKVLVTTPRGIHAHVIYIKVSSYVHVFYLAYQGDKEVGVTQYTWEDVFHLFNGESTYLVSISTNVILFHQSADLIANTQHRSLWNYNLDAVYTQNVVLQFFLARIYGEG